MFDTITSLPSPIFIGLVVIFVLVLLAIGMMVMRKVAEPNEALIISGRTKKATQKDGSEDKKYRIAVGEGAFYVPGYHTVSKLSLNQVKTELVVECTTEQGIPVTVKAAVNFKVGDSKLEIGNAVSRFLGNTPQQIVDQVHNVFTGHLRAITGNMTVEALIKDRETLRARVRDASQTEMSAMGLKIDSMQILEIDDPTGYIKNLAAPHIAAAESAARIAKAERDQEATEREQQAAIAVAIAQTAASKRQSELKAEADKAEQTAAQAGPLAKAVAQREVVVAETQAAELRATLTEKNLETEVRRPADAEAYRLRVTAEGQRDASIASATAAAQTTTLQAGADATATRTRGEAEAASIKATGDAEAAVIKAKGLAEAEAMDKRADALSKGKDALIALKVAEQLPEIVSGLAAPFGNIDKLTVLNGADGMSQMVVGAVGQLESLLPSLLKGFSTDKIANESTALNGSRSGGATVDA
jgi:uncharacterized membrane protein YqiK